MEPQDTSRKPSTRAKVATSFINEMGRIPPQAVELEQVVLGAMMLERNAVNDIIDILNEQSFLTPNTNIFSRQYVTCLRRPVQ